MLREKISLGFSFNAFGDDHQTQTFGENDDHFCNGRVVGVGEAISDETLVNFQLVERQAFQVRKR